jgi:hypothetical protein
MLSSSVHVGVLSVGDESTSRHGLEVDALTRAVHRAHRSRGSFSIGVEKAETARRIFGLLTKNRGTKAVARWLTTRGVPSPSRRSDWNCQSVSTITRERE